MNDAKAHVLWIDSVYVHKNVERVSEWKRDREGRGKRETEQKKREGERKLKYSWALQY